MEEDRDAQLMWIGLGGLAPIGAAMALVSLRNVMLNTNVALVLVTVVVVAASFGGRLAGAAAAVSAALSFDFFFTLPYLQLRIASADDVETTVLLLVVGLLVGTVGAKERRARSSADASRGEIRRIFRIAELAAHGDDASDVILVAQAELTAHAFSSAANNNGSVFAGLTTATQWYDTTLGLAMLVGRFFLIIPVLAIAGSIPVGASVRNRSGLRCVGGTALQVLEAQSTDGTQYTGTIANYDVVGRTLVHANTSPPQAHAAGDAGLLPYGAFTCGGLRLS